MTYIALARKWRPRIFTELLGQDAVKRVLVNSLEKNRIHHAYLFTGTRGVGKTSIARLFAKSLNCERAISATPCLQCNNCMAIETGQFIDLIEVDGASRTRVEDTRELLENIQFAPVIGRFKIYLIDEVHMLSNHSFNALLKTLEEPPEHVKFLLATTDPQKLPITVLSRCLQFNLKHLSSDTICSHLQMIMKEEKLDYDLEALKLISKAARGSVRDALSLLDQAIGGCENKLPLSQVKELLGHSQQDYAIQVLQALIKLCPEELLSISHNIGNEGGQFQFVLNELIQYLHQISIYQTIKFDHTSQNEELIQSLASNLIPEDVQLYYQIALKGQEELQLAPTPGIAFDMLLLRMYAFRPAPLMEKPTLAYEQVRTTSHLPPSAGSPDINIFSAPPSEAVMVSKNEGILDEGGNLVDNWNSILPQLKLTGLALSAAENAMLIERNDSLIALQVNKGHSSLFNPAIVKRIEEAFSSFFAEPIKLKLVISDNSLSTPAISRELSLAEEKVRAEEALTNDLVFQKFSQEFSAELVKNSITPVKDSL